MINVIINKAIQSKPLSRNLLRLSLTVLMPFLFVKCSPRAIRSYLFVDEIHFKYVQENSLESGRLISGGRIIETGEDKLIFGKVVEIITISILVKKLNLKQATTSTESPQNKNKHFLSSSLLNHSSLKCRSL